MAYRAVIRNLATNHYYNTNGIWIPQEVTVVVNTRLEAYRMAERLNSEVVQIMLKKARR